MDQFETLQAKKRREFIDMVAVTRFRSIRIALYGTQLSQSDASLSLTSEDHGAQLAILQETVTWVERVADIAEQGTDPWRKLDPDLCSWFKRLVDDDGTVAGHLRKMASVSRRIATAAENGSDDLAPALRAQFDARTGGFMEAVTAICDAMWASIDQEREEQVKLAKATGKTTLQTLARLEDIGQHVHLVSLNASVESARLGDAGRGITVIAVEFKSLAEEIQSLSVSAKADIAKLTQSG